MPSHHQPTRSAACQAPPRRRRREGGLWLLGAVVGLSGCVATAPVATPQAPAARTVPDMPALFARLPRLAAPAAGSPSAKVSVRAALVSPQHRAGLVQLLDSAQCRQAHLVGLAPRTAAPTPPNAATGAATAEPRAEPLPLSTGQTVTLDWLVTDGTRALCAVRWSFTPQADRHYLVQGASLGSLCTATLTDVTQPDRPRTPEDLRYRSEPGKSCVPLDQARRVPPGMLEGGQVNGEAVLRPLATEDDLKGLIKP